MLSALDARYLPEIDQDFAHLVSIDLEPWDEFRARWNALDASRALAAPAPDVRKFAETLLLMAHNIDPLGAWSQLVRRAPLEMSKTLTGDALGAVELRLAAEILLRFYEDLVRAGVAEPLPESRDFSRTYHPLGDRMSSNRIKPIDEILQDLHLSPHARVVLAVEGETEELLVPRVFDALELRQSPDLVRILCMRTDSRDLTMTVALNVAPILGQRLGDGYAMVRPPTAIIVASDPGQRWSTPQKVADWRTLMLGEIGKVISAQGGSVDPSDLEHLVIARPWKAQCFEFEHFTDPEISDALMSVHPTSGGMTRSEVIQRTAEVRASGKDIKKVWHGWNPQPSKTALAEALWPTLQSKILSAQNIDGAAVPTIAAVVEEAFLKAQSFRLGTYIVRAVGRPDTSVG